MNEDLLDKNDLTELVLLAKRKIKENTVGKLEDVSSKRLETKSDVEHGEETKCNFFIDTTSQLPTDMSCLTTSETGCDKIKETTEDKSPSLKFSEPAEQIELASKLDSGICSENLYVTFPDSNTVVKKRSQSHEKVLEKSVITPDFEKRHSIPSYQESKRQMKKQRKKEKDSSTGSGWYDMKAAEMTDELRRDLKLIQMRSILDPKRFYKNNDMKTIPKFVQIGKVVDSHIDFYNSRVPKKQRKSTIVDELLADDDLRKQNKRKYLDLQQKSMHKFSKERKRKKKGK
ncbi:deoxynucleotidyltransferase terminal-interacting protein 2-like [Antedon mediterranea]|uniref:deoxynucleotidyltransferase terminal-interacting protein 2-like n=1 Tax=Antedon mediterranea TaxID=105859 RepID=UPI003AF6EF8C